MLSVLRIAGFGWSVVGFACLVWILRSRRGSAQRPGRARPIMFRFGLVLFGVGIIGGLFLALFFGQHSAEFTNFFGYFVALWMLGTMLVFLGRPRSSGVLSRRPPWGGQQRTSIGTRRSFILYRNPYKMIMMKCPETGQAVKTGITSAYFDQWGGTPPPGSASFKCSQCNQTHTFDKNNTWLEELT